MPGHAEERVVLAALFAASDVPKEAMLEGANGTYFTPAEVERGWRWARCYLTILNSGLFWGKDLPHAGLARAYFQGDLEECASAISCMLAWSRMAWDPLERDAMVNRFAAMVAGGQVRAEDVEVELDALPEPKRTIALSAWRRPETQEKIDSWRM